MIKVRPSQVFDFDTEDLVAEGGRRAPDTSPAPTIDDRANLYLNAIYGAREFTGEEYARARRIILNAMTIDVEAARKDIVEGVPGGENSVPSEHYHTASPGFMAFDMGLVSEPDAEAAPVSRGPRRILPRHNARGRSFSVEGVPGGENSVPPEHYHAASFDMGLELEPDAEAAPVSRGPRRILPRHTARGRSFVLFGAIAGCLLLAAITTVTLPLVLPIMRTDSTQAKMTLSPSEIQTLLSQSNSLQVVETTATRRLASSELARRLFDLGNKLVAGGDLYGGRLILQEAANEGMASAAFALGATFDPIDAKALGQPDSSPDLEKARAWYIKAKLLGSTEAQARLDGLEKSRR
jgi:hypothetical protein